LNLITAMTVQATSVDVFKHGGIAQHLGTITQMLARLWNITIFNSVLLFTC